MRRVTFIALGCLVVVAILAAMWIGGRGNEVAAPFVRTGPTVTPFPKLDQRPLRLDVEQRVLSALPVEESVSHVEPLVGHALLVFNHDADAWELRDQSGARLETLAIPPSIAPHISPDRRRLAHVWGGAVVVYDSQEHTTRTVAQSIATASDVLWSNAGVVLAVLSPMGDGATRLLLVQAADGTVVTEKTWLDGEDVYLEGWTTSNALRVRVWVDGGCSPVAPEPQCVPSTSAVLEVDETGLTSVGAASNDITSYCGFDVSAIRCLVFGTTPSTSESAGLTSPDGLYGVALASDSPDGLYLRLRNTQDGTYTDIHVSLNDSSLVLRWSPDSRFVYLSRHMPCSRGDPPGC